MQQDKNGMTILEDVFHDILSDYKVLQKYGVSDELLRSYIYKWHINPVILSDHEGKVLFCNQAFLDILGYEWQEIDGKSIKVFYDSPDRDALEKRIERRRKGLSDVYSTKAVKKDGTVITTEIKGIPAYNNNQEFMGAFGVIKDVTSKILDEERKNQVKAQLEEEVEKRTRALTIANYHMVAEIKERKLVEEALKVSEKRFKDLFLNSPEAIFVEDFEGTILDVNDAGCILHGLTRDQILGKNARDFTADIHLFDSRQRSISMGELDTFDADIIHVSGRVVPVAVKSGIIEYNGQLSVLLHVRDISDRKDFESQLLKMNEELDQKVKDRTLELEREINFKAIAQEEIKKQNLFLQKLIDTNPNLIYVKNGNGEIILANQAFLSFYKLTQDKLNGAFENDVFEDEEFAEQSALYNEYAILDPNVLFEYSTEYKFKDLNTPAFLRVAKQSISLQNQDSNSIVTVITDLSELKENERRLKYSESLYRQIARNVPNSAIYVFDKKLVYHLAEGSLVGSISLPKDQIEGRHVLDTGEDMEVLKERAIRYQKVVEGHSDQLQIDEFGRSYLVNTTPIRNVQNEIIFGLVVILDVTELKKAQLELEEKNDKLARSNDELEKFAYVASHDLQSPLKTIISFLQLLEQRHGDALGEEGKEFINFCISSSTRMRNLITDLLNYSRVNSIPRPFVEANLGELMFIVTKNLESNIKAKKAQIEFDKLPTVLAEPYMLTQLLQNLVDNGMKFTKPDQPIKINVTYSHTPTHHQISVSDNGIGIKKEFQDKIFQIFQRLHTDTEYSGTGIGLAICKKVINHHSGEIWVDSVYGEGTTFHFTIKKNL